MTTIKQGDRGAAVLELQVLLAMVGHTPGPLDGIFGSRTRAAWSSCYVDRWGDPGDPHLLGMGDVTDDIAALRAAQRLPVELRSVRTPVLAVDMRIALAASYTVVFGRDPNVLAIRTALAQLCIEHGCAEWSALIAKEAPAPCPPRWGQMAYVNVWLHNAGNVQVHRAEAAHPTRPYFYVVGDEVLPSGRRPVRSPYPAFPSAAEGAVSYWERLARDYPHALPAFEAGDPEGAARLLKGLGDIGGPFAKNDMVAPVRGEHSENTRGRVVDVMDSGRVIVMWPTRRAEMEQRELRHAWMPFYSGNWKAYETAMVSRFKGIA